MEYTYKEITPSGQDIERADEGGFVQTMDRSRVPQDAVIAPWTEPDRVKAVVNASDFWAVLEENDIVNVTKDQVIAKANEILPVDTVKNRRLKRSIIETIETGREMYPTNSNLIILAAQFGITNGDFDTLWFEAEDMHKD